MTVWEIKVKEGWSSVASLASDAVVWDTALFFANEFTGAVPPVDSSSLLFTGHAIEVLLVIVRRLHKKHSLRKRSLFPRCCLQARNSTDTVIKWNWLSCDILDRYLVSSGVCLCIVTQPVSFFLNCVQNTRFFCLGFSPFPFSFFLSSFSTPCQFMPSLSSATARLVQIFGFRILDIFSSVRWYLSRIPVFESFTCLVLSVYAPKILLGVVTNAFVKQILLD